jgi:uncharacterized protein (DUF927 family)
MKYESMMTLLLFVTTDIYEKLKIINSYESHTFFHEFAVKKETFITCCTHYFFAYRKKLRNLV